MLTATNITELIWCEEIEALLRFCGVRESEIGETASDYEKFRALCGAMPYLQGHFLPKRLEVFLLSHFKIQIEDFLKDCDMVWSKTAARLLERPMPRACMLPPFHEVGAVIDSLPPIDVFGEGIFCGNDLLQTKSCTWSEWQNEIRQRLDSFWQKGGRFVFLHISEDAYRKNPDVYHVELSLQDRQDLAMLEAQLFRCLSSECQKRDLTVILQIDDPDEEVYAFLGRVERRVGLSDLILLASVSNMELYRQIWHFQGLRHDREVRFAVPMQTNSSVLSQIAAHYPIRRVLLTDITEHKIYQFQ